jgi:hypothetical protein
VTTQIRSGKALFKLTGRAPTRCAQAGDEDTAAAAKAGRLPRKLAARQKVLRSQAILQAAHAAKPVVVPPPRKPKGSVLEQQQRVRQQQKGGGGGGGVAGKRSKREAGEAAAAALDVWAEPQQEQHDGWTDALVPAKRQRRTGGRRAVAASSRARELPLPVVPAVEIDPAGCSYNPDPEAHQEAVAAAVAAETRKLLDKELQPLPVPRTVDYQPETDELALLQTLEGGGGGEEEEEEEGQEGQEGGEAEEDAGDLAAARRRQARRCGCAC